MPNALATAFVATHFALLSLLAIYGVRRLWVSLRQWRAASLPLLTGGFARWPVVTVQLPVYNERYVVERLLSACAALDYPRESLQIQLLDDSTDDTRQLAAAGVARYRAQGFDIQHLQRAQREGYKAGALAAGLRQARGEFIAIFDADFVPAPDTLKRALAPLADASVALVQLRWDHLNRDHSALTQSQAMLLDAHFEVEQAGRHRAGLFMNFNGTAGVWRARAIADAGGWSADTLTEDLDLSYRAQLRGWRFVLLEAPRCPAELPTQMNALKAQQQRWAKGTTQVMLKMLGPIWRARLPWRVKIEAAFHLTSNLGYLLVLLDNAVFLLPSLVIRYQWELGPILWLDVPVWMFCTLSHVIFFLSGQRLRGRDTVTALKQIPALLALFLGLTVNNARGVLQALRGRASGFVRTPKLGAVTRVGAGYRAHAAGVEHVEIALGLIYVGGLAWALHSGLWLTVPIFCLLLYGFLNAGLRGLHERRLLARSSV